MVSPLLYRRVLSGAPSPITLASLVASDGTEYTADSTVVASDGTTYTLDSTVVASDGTEYEMT